MWSKILNLLFIQLFVLQSFAFASPGKHLTTNQLNDAVTALHKLDKEEQKKLFLTVLPLIHKEDANTIDEKFFNDTIKNLKVEGTNLVFTIENEKAVIADINLEKGTAKLNGKPFSMKKSVREQLPTFLDTPKSTYLDFFIPSAHAAETPPVPNKLKVIGLIIAGTVAAIAAVGAGVWAWVKPKKGVEAAIVEEVATPKIEEVLSNDCKDAKSQVKRSKLGEKFHIPEEFIQKMRDKIAMLDLSKAEALKMKMKPADMKWIDDSKSCYGEVIELVELKNNAVKDEIDRASKEVPTKSVKQPAAQKKASKQ